MTHPPAHARSADITPVRLRRVRSRRRTASTASTARIDRGITLVEILMAVVLSSIVGAVLVATLMTSLNAADTTTSTVASSVDTQLIATFLTADAQAAGGIDPDTATLDLDLGVSTVGDAAGWADCVQPGTLAVRFAWMDRGTTTADKVVVTYAVAPDGTFSRKACTPDGDTTAVLARAVTAVDVSCSPFLACTGLPEEVSLQLQGGDAAQPFDVTLTASLRAESQLAPTAVNAAQVPLVLTGPVTCPALSTTGTGDVHVIGDAAIDRGCGASPLTGDLTNLRTAGTLSLFDHVNDPMATLEPPASCSGATGANPTIGSSTGPDAVTRYPLPVVVTGNVVFQPGRHVFCNGVTVAAGATVSGSGVVWYVADGAVTVDGTATIMLSPPTTGDLAGVVLWTAGIQPVTIVNGTSIDEFAGVVYAPDATVVVTSTSGVRLGAVVAESMTVAGTGPTRLGLPIPSLTVANTTLPVAFVAEPYDADAPAVSGGTAPYTLTATGLPAGLSMSTTGDITGTPTTDGTSQVTFLAVDATGASTTFTRSLTVSGISPPPATVTAAAGDTTATVAWTPGTSGGGPAATGYTVTLTASGHPTRTCTGGASATSCSVTGLVNGVSYSVAVTSSNANGTSAPTTTTVTPRPALLVGTGAQLWLDASDVDGDGTAEGAGEQCSSGSSCAAASNVLTRWEDKSGGNHDAVQPTSSMAGTFVPGMPAVDFDANGSYDVNVAAGPDLSVFVVAQSDTATWNTYGWLFAARSANGAIIHPWPGGSTVGSFTVNSAGNYLSSTDVAPNPITTPRIYDHVQAGSNPVVASTSLDGRLAGTLTHTGQTRVASSLRIRIGADDVPSGRLGDGKYREVLVFSRALSSTERRTVQEYLARKWQITITPASPTAVSALAANNGALVSWTAPVWDGGSAITGYTVTAVPGGATCTAAANATSCGVLGLTNGTAYQFVVTATNAAGAGDQSAPSNVATPGPPPAPTSPAAVTGTRQVTLSWTAPALNGHAPLLSYTVTATATGQPTQTCTATAPTTSCTVTNLVNDVAYSFAITASNAHGAGPAATVSATPTWTPAVLGSGLTWWFDASNPSALTGAWTTRSGFTVSGAAGSTRITASSGVVERVDVVSGGTGYTSSPNLTFVGGGGTGAVAGGLAVNGGSVSLPNLWQRGSGYTSEPTVTPSGGGGTGAVLRARIMVPVTVGATIRINGATYTVTDRDGLTLTISPALASAAAGASIDEWKVSNWDNLAPNALPDARQTTVAQRPSLGTMSGRPAVAFSGIDEFLAILQSGDAPFDKGANWTVLVAYQAERQVSWGAVGQEWNAINTRVVASAGPGVVDWMSSQNVEIDVTEGVDSVNGGPVRVGVDHGDGTDSFHWTRMNIGGLAEESRSSGWDFGGTIGEVIVVNGGLDSLAVADATAYLATKWSQPAVVPSAPINVTAAPSDGSAVVQWRAANQYLSAITGYTVTATATGQTTRTCTSAGTSCTLTGLANGAPYTVTVTATNATGTGPASVPITLITRPAILVSTNSRVWLDSADIDGDGRVEGVAGETGSTSGSVSAWNDKSGRNNHTSAPSGQAPTASAQTMNGLPVITFNGTTILQGTPAANPYGITGDRTMFVVTRRRSGTPTRIIDRVPADTPLFGITAYNLGEVRADDGTQYQYTAGSTATSVAGTTYVLSGHRAGSELVLWSNARSIATSSITGTQTQRALTIGRHATQTSTSDHDVAEVVLFDRALTTTERRQVEQYLRLKWGVTLAPAAPTDAAATQTREVVTVTWTAPADDGGSPVTGYTVTAAPGGAVCTSTTTSCAFTGLTPGTSYTFTVTATNAVGTGPASTASTAITKNQIVGAVATPTPYNTWFDGTHMWAANDGGTVSRIDPATGTTLATITVGLGPTSFAQSGTTLWVSNFYAGTVSRINMSTNAVTATLNLGGSPYGMVANGTDLWVANMNLGQIQRVNTSTLQVTQTINAGSASEMTMAFGSIWVSRNTTSPGRVMRIDPSTGNVLQTISVGNKPYNMVSDGTYLWVANYGSGTLSKINPSNNTVVSTVSVGASYSPYDVILANGKLWVSLPLNDAVVSVNPGTGAVGTIIPLGDEPTGLTHHPATNRIWVSNLYLDWIYLINA